VPVVQAVRNFLILRRLLVDRNLMRVVWCLRRGEGWGAEQMVLVRNSGSLDRRRRRLTLESAGADDVSAISGDCFVFPGSRSWIRLSR